MGKLNVSKKKEKRKKKWVKLMSPKRPSHNEKVKIF